ncbi:rhodanese-like domain-containing protein [uncultured Sunxiuqinia sp.]|uniref:rhodanese-like domain-containing protein n=1 Tax=uncultured Sunxiuqinia sp. TaxID=1573825 RepID=UPI00199F2529|nr:rhodanese-like domain-containing protein [Sunxiuqinia sp.]
MENITTEQLRKKLDKNDIVLIEVLDEEQYQTSHLPGAINIPVSRIGTEVKQRFESDQEIVVYCSDVDCSASPTAAGKLDDLGFEHVYDYEEGKKAWREAGLPMEK